MARAEGPTVPKSVALRALTMCRHFEPLACVGCPLRTTFPCRVHISDEKAEEILEWAASEEAENVA